MPGIAVAPFDEAQAKAHQKAWADYLGVPVESTNSIGMKLVVIPPGTFKMGSPKSEAGRDDDEEEDEDLVDVALSRSFLMQQCEVTQEQWSAVMKSTPWIEFDKNRYFRSGPNYPASNISWHDADNFCKELTKLERNAGILKNGQTYRLPTEAEWEFACRAGTDTAYYFGNNADELNAYAWNGNNAWDKREMYPHEVGTKLPNAWQLFDMHGNVAEWCMDSYSRILPGGRDPLANSGPDLKKVLHGGGWASRPENNRSARRGGELPEARTDGTGFRVVCDIAKSDPATFADNQSLPASLSQGLVAYYPFSGNARDESGNEHHGVPTNVSGDSDRFGQTGKALKFSGDTQVKVVLPDGTLSPASDNTISLWVRCDQFASAHNYLFHTNAPAGQFVEAAGIGKDKWHSTYGASGGASVYANYEPGITFAKWYNVALVWGDRRCVMYVNGEPGPASDLLSENTPASSPSNTLLIGALTKDHKFSGAMDDLRIYRRALSAEELKALYHYESRQPGNALRAPPPAIASFDAAAAKAHQQSWADHLGVPVVSTNSIGMKLVVIPPGEFMMGSPASDLGRQGDETHHRVSLARSFQIGAYEVTQTQYEKVMGENPGHFKGPDNPVDTVSWDDAMEFCHRLSGMPKEKAVKNIYRLPTEAEWEFACRAATTTAYSFGDDELKLTDFAWFDDNSGDRRVDRQVIEKMDRETYYKWLTANNFRTHAVGTKDANDFGLYDMHGNVWEWCLDIHAVLPAGFEKDPSGPSTGSKRSTRGGSADSPPEFCRSSSRLGNAPSDRGVSLGFRVYCELESSPEPAVAPFDTSQAKANQKAWANHLGVPVVSTNSIGMKMVLIPPGEFMMGSPESEREPRPDETLHQVTLTQSFQIGVCEVTQSQYEKVIGANPSSIKGPDNPVEQINWDEASAFCRRLSALKEEKALGHVYRLPTEAEWEYACRAGTTTAYSFGNDTSQLVDFAWAKVNSGEKPQPVGQKNPNSWGLYDMHGNVWEWCQDWQGDLPSGAVTDPQGPSVGTNRADRGGCWSDTQEYLRAGLRGYNSPIARGSSLGFRVVCEIKSSPTAAIAPFDTAQAKAHQKAWADHLGVPVVSTNSIGMSFVLVPAGRFEMGSPDSEPDRVGNELLHNVQISRAYGMSVFEVTQEQFESVLQEKIQRVPGDAIPVGDISWDDANSFCRQLSEIAEEKSVGRIYRLPTEAEWEFACRAGMNTRFLFGDDDRQAEKHAWLKSNSDGRPHKIGLKKPNAWGLYDMHGNVWEWCSDWFGDYPSNAITLDQVGPASGPYHVGRGGGWVHDPKDLRAAFRLFGAPTGGYPDLGFRVVLVIQ
ncbi:MAG: SUMF1/EgtB/PvdO family nonheme iron enzyme [Planctomycetales bacterium]|nr:SUMF1/EgtB/PvdO family nonheme iron enzyme [Planctomycetales bacterium]